MSALDPSIDGITNEIARLKSQINDARNREDATVQEVRQRLHKEIEDLEKNVKEMEDQLKHLRETRDQINRM